MGSSQSFDIKHESSSYRLFALFDDDTESYFVDFTNCLIAAFVFECCFFTLRAINGLWVL